MPITPATGIHWSLTIPTQQRAAAATSYHGVPLVWASRLQTVFALSTAEAKYISLSTALRDVIPMMDLLAEMSDKGFQVQSKPTVHCKLFEDKLA
jgi:hypothetical protein